MHCLFGPGAAYLLMNMGASPFFIFSGCFLRMIRHFLPIILSKSFRRSDCITYTTYDYDSGFWCGMYKVEICYQLFITSCSSSLQVDIATIQMVLYYKVISVSFCLSDGHQVSAMRN